MARRNIVVIGASSGGIEALKVLVAQLPASLDAALFVVLHIGADSPGLLPSILERAGELPACNASDMQAIKMGSIYVAPPDFHLLLERGHVRVTRGPKENRSRPAIDPLFRSAAYIYGARVVGIVLTGNLDDGTAGLWAIKHREGTTVVQDPKEAIFDSMPTSALTHVEIDHCLPIAKIAPLIVRLSNEEVEEKGMRAMPKEIEYEVKIANEKEAIATGVRKLGDPSPFTCPECHGVLLRLPEPPRFRCHTGHAFSIGSLLAEASESSEAALWSAIRSLDENVLLMHEAARQLRDQKREKEAGEFTQQAEETYRRSEAVRRVVSDYEKPVASAVSSDLTVAEASPR